MRTEQTSFQASQERVGKALRSSSRSLWLGAISFEERCSGSLQVLAASGNQVTEGIALDYSSGHAPSKDEFSRRSKHWKFLRTFEGSVFVEHVSPLEMSAYSFQDLQQWIQQFVAEEKFDTIVLDITCMTKIHALALAVAMSQWPRDITWVVAYTVPENYNHLTDKRRSLGWRDIIVAPLAETANLLNEAQGRGIVIPGHEPDRLIVALSELEPSGGMILMADTPRRPDLRRLSERANQKIIRQLTRKRSENWSTHVVPIHDAATLGTYVGGEIALAQASSAPAILFPFGPKSLIFLAGLQLACLYPQASWFVYPIPYGYDVNYSEGVEQTIWLFAGGADSKAFA